MNTAAMRVARNAIFSLGIALALSFAALWLATASPTVDAPGRPEPARTVEFFCIQAPWDVVLNHGEGQQTGGEWPIDYAKTETACDEAGRRRFGWAMGAGAAAALAGVAVVWFAAAAFRSRHSREE
jgi:disulfide bond formation protein DsbB